MIAEAPLLALLDDADRDRALDALRPRATRGLVEWSQDVLRVIDGPLVAPGASAAAWSPQAFALQRAIMQAIDDPRWAAVVVVGPPQSGKSFCANVAPLLHRLLARGQSAMYVHANADKARDFYATKLLPVIQRSPELAGYLPELRDEQGAKGRRQFTNGATLFLAGSESEANLAQATCPCVVCDDVQAMPPRVGKLGHPVETAAKRQESFPQHSRTTVISGTAGKTGDYHWQALQASTLWRPYLPCAACGVYQLLEWERMEFDPADAAAARASCRMRCANAECTHRWSDHELLTLLRGVRWVSTAGMESPPETVDLREERAGSPYHPCYPQSARPSLTAGFWYNALYWPWASWGALAARFVAGRGDPDQQRDFMLHVRVEAEPPPEDALVLAAEEIETHVAAGAAAYKQGVVPAGVDVLTLAIDVQNNYVYWILSGWKKDDGTSWLIDLGSTKQVHEVSGNVGGLAWMAQRDREGWPDENGELRRPDLIAVDSRYQPDVVHRHCRRYGLMRWRPIQGVIWSQAIWPARPAGKAGRRYWPIAVNEAKSLMVKLLAIAPGDPGYWHMPCDLKPQTLRAYSRHMASESWDGQKRRWVRRRELEPPAGEAAERAGRNDWWDCSVYGLAAAVGCGVTLLPPEQRQRPRAAPAASPEGRSVRPLMKRGPVRRTY